ncbi:MAG: ABC transporter ATP-binding protein [Desulfurococcales archaeon]|nr:ABC transporter ATP-binding protein [Desulfurococcales archaeon]
MSECSVVVEDLWKEYPGGIVAVRGVSFEAGRGFTSLMGPNGSGKTTTLSMVAGALKPSRGRIVVCGLDVWGREGVRARRLIGFAPQDMPFKEKLSGMENLVWIGMIRGLGYVDAKRQARRALELVGLEAHGNRRVVTYSGGMRRRLTIAACVMHEPEVLLLDEPGSGLDPRAREEVWGLIESLGRGRIIVYSTHISQEAERHSDRVLIFHSGGIVAGGPPRMLIERYAPMPRIIVYHDPGGAPPMVDGLPGYSRGDGVTYYEVEEASSALPKIIEAFLRAGIQVHKVEVKRPGLEEVYFRVTGARLEA